MQKKLIALAVAGLASTAAFAQTNVTIYGIADVGYVNVSSDRAGNATQNFNGINSGVWSTSRIGFRGEEALGNGLKAIFTLEYGLGIDTGAALGAGRQQFVGLSSDKLGTVTLGRLVLGADAAMARNDITSVANLISAQSNLSTHGVVAGSAARTSNAIMYASPSFAGFKATVGYSYGENAMNQADKGVSTGNNGMFDANLNYANGPLNVDLYYRNKKEVVSAGVLKADQNDVREWGVGASYDLKVVKLAATFQDRTDDTPTATPLVAGTLADNSGRVWQVGASVPVMGNGTVYATYGQSSYDASGQDKVKFASVGYTHALSKRTMAYAGYTHISNGTNVLALGTNANAAHVNGGAAVAGAAGENVSAFGAGIRHLF